MAKLQASERYKLTKMIEADYARLAITDGEFAELATGSLGFEVTAGGVQFARESIGLLSTRQIKREAGQNTIESRLNTLEDGVLALIKEVERLRTAGNLFAPVKP